MSKCMTIDETIDQKDTFSEGTPKDIIDSVLEEILVSVLTLSDKSCNRIGDFNINEDFCQQYNQPLHVKDFEQVNLTETTSEANLIFGNNKECPGNENSEADRLGKTQVKPAAEDKVIKQDVVATDEEQIRNEQNNLGKNLLESARVEYYQKEDIIKDEKLEIGYFDQGKLNKIYVPLNEPSKVSNLEAEKYPECENELEKKNSTNENRSPFEVAASEELEQSRLLIPDKENSFLDGKVDYAVACQQEKLEQATEELPNVQVHPDDFADPYRPRACSFAKEDIEKLTKEIEEIKLPQRFDTAEDYPPDGQGDADLESKSFTRSKDILNKSKSESRILPEHSSDYLKKEEEVHSADMKEDSKSKSVPFIVKDPSSAGIVEASPPDQTNSTCIGSQEDRPEDIVPNEELTAEYNLQYETRHSKSALPDESIALNNQVEYVEDIKENIEYSVAGSIDLLEFHERIFTRMPETVNSRTLSGNDIFSEFTVPSGTGTAQLASRLQATETFTGPSVPAELHSSAEPEVQCSNTWLSQEAELPDEEKVKPSTDANAGSVEADDIAQNLKADDSTGNLEAVGAAGSKKADEAAGNLKADDSAGNLEAVDAAGSLKADDSAGNLKADGAAESLKADDSAGNLKADDATGNLEAGDAAGNLEVDDVAGSLVADENAENLEADDYAENVEILENRHSHSYTVTNAPLQALGVNSCSQGPKASVESVVKSKGPESLKSQTSLTNLDNQLQEAELQKSESEKFKLHSAKMYSRMGFDKKKNIISNSEEAFIQSTESVLQVLEPEENSQDEMSESVSLLHVPQESNEIFQKSSFANEVEIKSDVDENNEDQLSDEIIPKYSGMTTIGPMKNTDYDPKDLTAPDIDFGRMTRITSSRQLSKDINLLGADMTSATAVKIIEENDSDESITEVDNDCLEATSLVNRDIASLTKFQKIREVMSYQPKLEDDFDDEESLPKPRLDLKDVESSTDARHKMPEVSIPHLSLEVTTEDIGTDSEAEKQLIESMGLIISGLTEPFYENLEKSNDYEDNPTANENLEEDLENLITNEEAVNELVKDESKKDTNENLDSPETASGNWSKYGTLSNIIKKSSIKSLKKESSTFFRNSKSLPRDASKISATNSIRSILDDCSASASGVLKKSRSMLRNTQSLFKTISQNRMGNDNDLDKHKISPSESDLSSVERKLSFLKKEDFTKAKNLIKSTMEKTFRRQENPSETDVEQNSKVSEEKKEFQVAIRNEEKLRVDRMENFKKWLPKSPLVYKSQFVKSQIKLKDRSSETNASSKEGDVKDESPQAETELATATDVEPDNIQVVVNKIEATFQQERNEETTEEFNIDEYLEMIKEETQPDYIVMETVHGLPVSDPESPSSGKENVEINVTFQECAKESDIVPEHKERKEEKMALKIPSEQKITKKKKLSTRIRNFWCLTFGRVKTPPEK